MSEIIICIVLILLDLVMLVFEPQKVHKIVFCSLNGNKKHVGISLYKRRSYVIYLEVAKTNVVFMKKHSPYICNLLQVVYSCYLVFMK